MGSIYTSSQFTGGDKVKGKEIASVSMNNPVQYDFKSNYNDAKFPPNTDFINTTVSASGHLFQGTNYEQDKTSITINQGISSGPTVTDV